MFEENEVREATLEYFGDDDLATNVFMTKYCLARIRRASLLKKLPMICTDVWLKSLHE